MWGAGNVHLGTATGATIIMISAAGQPIYALAPQSDIAGNQQVILGKKGQELVRSPKDLEKLKIGMPKGASMTLAIDHMAKDSGIDFGKMQFVNLSPPDSVTALAKGDIDAMAGWAPWVFTAIKNGGKGDFTGNQELHPGQGGPGRLAPAARQRGDKRQDAQGEPEHAQGRPARAREGDHDHQH